MRERRIRGFTLVELLVVVGIIGLLASVTMPSLAAARRVSKRTKCQHNLHQIGVAIHEYLLNPNHRDTFFHAARLPSAELLKPENQRLPSLPLALKSETGGNSALFECPADKKTKDPEPGKDRYFDIEGTSYEWEWALNGLRVGFRRIHGILGFLDLFLRDVWMVSDFETYHGGPRMTGSYNILYADLRVESDKVR